MDQEKVEAGQAMQIMEQQSLKREDELSLALDADRFDQMTRIAEMMSRQSLLPDHLVVRPFWAANVKGVIPPTMHKTTLKEYGEEIYNASIEQAEQRTAANCFRVVNQAFRWRMDPFSIVDKTYSIGDGKLSYEGQLVAAVVNTRAGLRARLEYDFTGEPGTDGRTIKVSGTFIDEVEPRTVDLSVGQAKTNNEIWRKDPDQKLVYSGSIKWARRWCPEIMLGVLTDDDLERIQTKVIETSPAPVEPEAAVTADVDVIIESSQVKTVPTGDPEQLQMAAKPAKKSEPPPVNNDVIRWLDTEITEHSLNIEKVHTVLRQHGIITEDQTWEQIPETATHDQVRKALAEV